MTMNPISRRTVLKGMGVSLALPFLDAMVPGLEMTPTLLANERTAAPKRIAFLYVPNGINMEEWTPSALGTNFELPAVLRPLQAVKDDMLVLSGLTLDKARANGDGGGDHARAMSSFLTGCQPRKTHGADIQVGNRSTKLRLARLDNTLASRPWKSVAKADGSRGTATPDIAVRTLRTCRGEHLRHRTRRK